MLFFYFHKIPAWIPLLRFPFLFPRIVRKCKSQIRKLQYVLSVFSVGISLFLTSCSTVPIERGEPKQPDLVKQEECRQKGQGSCKGNEGCENICDDLFSQKSHKQGCYEYSSELVSDFKNLIEATEEGDIKEIKDIGSDVLECMLDIDEQRFAEAVKEMRRGAAQELALLIADDRGFATVLEEEDEEFNILKQLLRRLAGSSDLTRSLSQIPVRT